MHLVNNQWLKYLIYICVQGLFCLLGINFPKKSCQSWWKKTKQLYVLPILVDCYNVTSFDLWMPKGAHDIFAFGIKFLGAHWHSKHIAIGLFKAFNMFRHALTKDLIELLGKYDLKKKTFSMLKMKDLI
jgi:hypothetical protein